MDSKENNKQTGENGNMKAKHTRECRTCNVFTAPQQDHDRFSDHRHDTCDIRSDFGGKEGQFVPGEKIAAEAETHSQKQHGHPGKPRYFPRFAIRLCEIHAEHMNDGGKDEKVGGPAVDGTDQPPEFHLRHDKLDAFKSELFASFIVKKKENPCYHLNNETKGGLPAERAPRRASSSGCSILRRSIQVVTGIL